MWREIQVIYIEINKHSEVKIMIKVDEEVGYTLEQVVENEVDYGAKWLEMGWFESDEFEDECFYYFSNYYGSEGAYYNEDTDTLITGGELDDMEDSKREEIEDNWEFVELPIDRQVTGLHEDYEDINFRSLYNPIVIKDEDDLSYKDGRGLYQYLGGKFYPVELSRW